MTTMSPALPCPWPSPALFLSWLLTTTGVTLGMHGILFQVLFSCCTVTIATQQVASDSAVKAHANPKVR